MEFDWVIGSSGQPESLNILLVFSQRTVRFPRLRSPLFSSVASLLDYVGFIGMCAGISHRCFEKAALTEVVPGE